MQGFVGFPVSGLHLNKATLQRSHYGVSAIIGPEFGKYALQVILDSVLRDAEVGRNDLVRASSGHTRQHVKFSGRKPLVSCVLGHFTGYFGRNSPLSSFVFIGPSRP